MSGDFGSPSRRRRRFQVSSRIDVTPLVDVMMVLLIIFMISAPMMTAGVDVNLPPSCAGPIQDDSEPLIVTITAHNKIYIQETETTLEKLAARLLAIAHHKMDTKIFLKADKKITHGQAMAVMGAISAAGFTKIAIVSEHAPKS